MASAYIPPEAATARKRADGKKLTLAGAVTAGFGVLGIVLSAVLNTVFLGILGGPIGGLGWLALIVGGGVFAYGFLQIKQAHETRT